MDAYKGDIGFFRSTLHIATDKALGKGEYPIRWLYAVYFMSIFLYFLHNGFRHGNGAYTIVCFGRCHNIAVCPVLQGFGNIYSIIRKIEVCQREGEKFTETHTGIEKKLQGCVCADIRYIPDELVVLFNRPKAHGAGSLAHVSGSVAWI